MSRSTLELDLFQMEKQSSPSPKSTVQNKLLHRRRSFRDIQSGISKLNPELLKTLIRSGSVNQSLIGKSSDNNTNKSFSVPSSPKDDQTLFPALPVYTPTFRPNSCSDSAPQTAPLTIFYNGTVAVSDVPQNKAENILKLAEGVSKAVESSDQPQLLETINNGDLPIARRKSLQSFLEKRKERLTLASPYGSPRLHFWSTILRI